MTLLSIAVAPVAIILFYIYFRDKYEKEPKKLIFQMLLLGCLSTIPAGIIESFFNFEFKNADILQIFITTFFVVGIVEEGAKFLFLKAGIWNNKYFNEYFDGIVYSIAVSLGFALLENILYVFSDGLGAGIMRAFTAVPAHAICAVIMGYYLGKARLETKRFTQFKLLFLSFFIPVIIHGMYDFLLFAIKVNVPLIIIFFIPYLIFIFVVAFDLIKKSINLDATHSFNNLDEQTEYSYALFWRRLIASIFDSILLFIQTFIIIIALWNFFDVENNSDEKFQLLALFISILLPIMVSWLYTCILESSKFKATIGKMILKLEVLSEGDMNRISFGKANTRFWSRVLSFLPLFAGYFAVFFNQKRQTFHDILSKTLVMHRKTVVITKPEESVPVDLSNIPV